MAWFSLGDLDPEELKRVMEEARRKADELIHLRMSESLKHVYYGKPIFEDLCKPQVGKRRAAEIDGGE